MGGLGLAAHRFGLHDILTHDSAERIFQSLYAGIFGGETFALRRGVAAVAEECVFPLNCFYFVGPDGDGREDHYCRCRYDPQESKWFHLYLLWFKFL